jgi:hypothetical protein
VRLILSATLLVLHFSSCKATEGDFTVEKAIKLTPSSGEIVGFNWSTSAGDLKHHIEAQAKDAHKKNSAVSDFREFPQNGIGGYGVYLADNPIMSIAYGEDLSCVSISPEATVAVKSIRGGPNEDKAAKLKQIQNASNVYIYPWGTDLEELNLGRAAVVRDSFVVDFNRSKKFSLKEVGNLQGLSSPKLSRGRLALKAGNLCEALSIYEGEYGSFIYSWLTATIDWKTQDPTLWGEIFPGSLLIKSPSVNPIFFADFNSGVKEIANDMTLVKELQNAGKTRVGASRASLESDISSTLFQFLTLPANGNLDVKLAESLITKSLVLELKGNIKNTADFMNIRFNAFASKLTDWESEHQEEVKFMRDFRQQLKNVSIRQKEKANFPKK